MLSSVSRPYNDMQTFFGIAGGATSVVIAIFANTMVSLLNLGVALYVDELSEAFMGAQNRGWGCGYSNGGKVKIADFVMSVFWGQITPHLIVHTAECFGAVAHDRIKPICSKAAAFTFFLNLVTRDARLSVFTALSRHGLPGLLRPNFIREQQRYVSPQPHRSPLGRGFSLKPILHPRPMSFGR